MVSKTSVHDESAPDNRASPLNTDIVRRSSALISIEKKNTKKISAEFVENIKLRGALASESGERRKKKEKTIALSNAVDWRANYATAQLLFALHSLLPFLFPPLRRRSLGGRWSTQLGLKRDKTGRI